MIAQQARRAFFLGASLLSLGVLATAQTNPAPKSLKRVSYDTGVVYNNGTDIEQVAVLYIDEPGTPWMRVNFDDVVLAGNLDLGNASYLKITSLEDGYFQLLNAESMLQWRNESAYFNGGSLQIELFASPGTGANRLSVNQLTLGAQPPVLESQCGATDDRIPSSDPFSARILPVGCTGFLIDDACGCFLTAGHCTFATQTVQFNVPASNSNGSLNNPPPSDQYSVDNASLQSNGGQGVGNDWGYFGVFPNSTTGQMPRTAQGGNYTFANPPAYDPSKRVRITGYGVDGGTRNQTQQTNVGPWLNYNGTSTALSYQTDTEGGNSGSPIIQEEAGTVMGIHTHGGCSATAGNNGTAAVHSGLQNALANPQGVCKKVTPPTCGTLPVAVVDNGTGANPLCLTNLSEPALGTTWDLAVDTSVVAGANFAGVRLQATGGPTTIELGELLLDLSRPVLITVTTNGTGTQVLSLALPSSVNLAGFSASAQGFVGVNGRVRQLCNAIQFTLGCQQ